MKKADFIERYGENAYMKLLAQSRAWSDKNHERHLAAMSNWRINNQEKVVAGSREGNQKGGKYYDARQEYLQKGVPKERHIVRSRDGKRWRLYKRIIAPGSQLHHQWRPQSALYDGVALVEADQHMHGFINVIEILKGKITLLTEKEIREQRESGSAF